MAARYCGGNGVAENGKAAAAVQHRYAYRRCTLCLSLRVRGITQLLPLLSHPESFYAFFLFPPFSTKVKNNLLEYFANILRLLFIGKTSR